MSKTEEFKLPEGAVTPKSYLSRGKHRETTRVDFLPSIFARLDVFKRGKEKEKEKKEERREVDNISRGKRW